MKVFASTMLYALGKRLGMQGALAEFGNMMSSPTRESLPVARTIYRLRTLCDINLWVDCGATVIGKARSRAFHEARKADCEAWVSIDDDVDVTMSTLAAMLEVLSDELVARVVVVPYLLRGDASTVQMMSVELPLIRQEYSVAGAPLLRLPHPARSGFGLVGMNRLALERIAGHCDESFTDGDGSSKLAVFHDMLRDGKWYGEDLSFFRRVPDDVEVGALLVGVSSHDGLVLSLDKL
jgi:hypothetical protein